MAGRIAYYGNIVTNGLVLDLDAAKRDSYPGTGTTWNDISGFQTNGTLTNGPTYNTDGAGSIIFDGVNDYANLGTSTSLNSSNITFSAWVKRTASWGSGACLFWAKNAADYTSNGFYIEFYSPLASSLATAIITNGAAVNWFRDLTNSNTSFPLNAWTYFSFTLNGSSPTMYFNGSSVSIISAGTNAITPTSSTKYILWNSYTNYTSANISQILIYNRALSASEILQNYNATKGRYQ
jgi:hypothetical protein